MNARIQAASTQPYREARTVEPARALRWWRFGWFGGTNAQPLNREQMRVQAATYLPPVQQLPTGPLCANIGCQVGCGSFLSIDTDSRRTVGCISWVPVVLAGLCAGRVWILISDKLVLKQKQPSASRHQACSRRCCSITGGVSVDRPALSEQGMHAWCDEIRQQVLRSWVLPRG